MKISIRKAARIAVLLLFLLQVVFLSYFVPQAILLNFGFTKEIKLSLVIAGFAIGILFFTKGKERDPNEPEEP